MLQSMGSQSQTQLNNSKTTTRAPSPTKRKDCSNEKSKDRSKDKWPLNESRKKENGGRGSVIPVVAAPGLAPATPEAPAHPVAPAPEAPQALQVLFGADRTSGILVPNPNHPKEMKRGGKGRALSLNPAKSTVGG